MNSASTLEFALIGLLREKPQSGYDLRKAFTTTAMRHFSDSPGSIYPALKRLNARGWLSSEPAAPSHPENRRRRQVFHLTAAGEAALIEQLSLPVTRDEVIWHMPDLMLRFAFMDTNVPRTTALRFLNEFELALGAYVADLRIDLERMTTKMSLNTGLLAFQSGIEGFEAQLSWARKARALLAEEAR